MVAKEQQSQPLASQSPPAWASHTEHMMTDSSEGGKQPHHHQQHETDALVADYYGSYSNSPQSQQSSSNSLLTLSPRSSTSQASNPASLDFTKNMKYNDEHHHESAAAVNVNIAALASLDSVGVGGSSRKASRVRKATPSKCASGIGAAASNSMRSPSNLKCQLCLFASQSRLEFSQHLSTHCRNLDDIEPQEFTKLVLEQLNGNLGPADDLASPAKKTNYNNNNNNVSNNNNNNENNNDSGSLDIPAYDQSGDELGLRVPRVQTNGKVKLFRCKQCPYVAIVKIDFWDHSRLHIKPEKLLTCPKCPFVTEYKHHLEYHLRNHFGSKPFKCEQCEYSCVNKSMLNSHLKSHSDVYQFRCNECNYATKYCHSLKLHLRKYNHTPSVVLNTDGTPNPLPIVDVYGTRRGPKTKSEDTTPPPQDIVSALLPVVVSKLQPARQQKQQQQQQLTPPPPQQQEAAAAAAAVPSPQPQYNFGNSSPIRFNSPIGGGPAPPQLPITPAASPKSPPSMPYIDQEDAATTIHLLASLGGGPASFNPYLAAAAMQAASSRVAELGGRAGLRAELEQLTRITNPAFLGSADMCSRVLTLTLNILGEGVKHAESRSSSSGGKRVVVGSSPDSSGTDTASSQEGAPLDLSKANNSQMRNREDAEAPQDLTKNNNNKARSNSYDDDDDDHEEEEEEDQEDDADEQPVSELGAIVAKLCRHKPVMRSVHGSLAFLRQYLMFLRAAQLQSLGFM